MVYSNNNSDNNSFLSGFNLEANGNIRGSNVIPQLNNNNGATNNLAASLGNSAGPHQPLTAAMLANYQNGNQEQNIQGSQQQQQQLLQQQLLQQQQQQQQQLGQQQQHPLQQLGHQQQQFQQQLHQLQIQQQQQQQQQQQHLQPRMFQQQLQKQQFQQQQQQLQQLQSLQQHFQQLQQQQPQQMPPQFQQLQAAAAQPHAFQLQFLQQQQQHLGMLQQLQQAQLQQQQQQLQQQQSGQQPQAARLSPNGGAAPGSFDAVSMNLGHKLSNNDDLLQQFQQQQQQKKKLNQEMGGAPSDGSEGIDALLNSFGNNIPQGLVANNNAPGLNAKNPQGVGGFSKPLLLNGLNSANASNFDTNSNNHSQFLFQAVNGRNQVNNGSNNNSGMSKGSSEGEGETQSGVPPGFADMLKKAGNKNIEKQLFENTSHGTRANIQDNTNKSGAMMAAMKPFGTAELDLDLANANFLAGMRNLATKGLMNMNGANNAMMGQHNMMKQNPVGGVPLPAPVPATSNAHKKGPKGNKKKKIEGKPRRPLSAYNLFFKEERAKMLKETDSNNISKMKDESKYADDDADDSKDSPGSKIGFENMAKIIGKRWRELAPEKASHFKKLADEDMKRYKAEMETFLCSFQPDEQDLKDDFKFIQNSLPQPLQQVNKTATPVNQNIFGGMNFVPGDEGILPSGLLSEAADNVSFDSSEKQFPPKKKRKNNQEDKTKKKLSNNFRDDLEVPSVSPKTKKGPQPKKKPAAKKPKLSEPNEANSLDPLNAEKPKKKRGRKKKVKPDEVVEKALSADNPYSPPVSRPSSSLDVSDIYDTFVAPDGNTSDSKKREDSTLQMPNQNGNMKPNGMDSWNMLNSQQQSQQQSIMMQLLKNAAAATGNDISSMYGMLGLNNMQGQTMNPQAPNQTNDMEGKLSLKGENQQEQNMWHV